MMGNKAEVVIVGAGLVGAPTAYFLARQGMKSVIVERDAIGCHASGFSYAALGTYDEAGMTGAHFDVASHAIWSGPEDHRLLEEPPGAHPGPDNGESDRYYDRGGDSRHSA